jgi:hypothetical protein
MPKIIDYDLDARKKLQAGVDKLAEAVGVRMSLEFEKSDGPPQMSSRSHVNDLPEDII